MREHCGGQLPPRGHSTPVAGSSAAGVRRSGEPASGVGEAAQGIGTEGPGEAASGKGWSFGVARYGGSRIEWFRIFSLAPRPRRVLLREEIEIVGRRRPVGQEELALLSGSVVLHCLQNGRPLELAMSEDALTGFLAWLEAAPPGQRVNVA
nr:DUF2550 domain-containing protein [Allostreptomyces psammosilenae]